MEPTGGRSKEEEWIKVTRRISGLPFDIGKHWKVEEGDTGKTLQLALAYIAFSVQKNNGARFAVPSLGYVVSNTKSEEEEWVDLDPETPISSLRDRKIRCYERVNLDEAAKLAFYQELFLRWKEIASRVQRAIKAQEGQGFVQAELPTKEFQSNLENLLANGEGEEGVFQGTMNWVVSSLGPKPDASQEHSEIDQWNTKKEKLLKVCMPMLREIYTTKKFFEEAISYYLNFNIALRLEIDLKSFIVVYFSSLAELADIRPLSRAVQAYCENFSIFKRIVPGRIDFKIYLKDMIETVHERFINAGAHYEDLCGAVASISSNDQSPDRMLSVFIFRFMWPKIKERPDVFVRWLKVLDSSFPETRKAIFRMFSLFLLTTSPSKKSAEVVFQVLRMELDDGPNSERERDIYASIIKNLKKLLEVSPQELRQKCPPWLKEEKYKQKLYQYWVYERQDFVRIYEIIEAKGDVSHFAKLQSLLRWTYPPNPFPTAPSAEPSGSSIFNSVVFKVASLFIFISLCFFSIFFARREKRDLRNL